MAEAQSGDWEAGASNDGDFSWKFVPTNTDPEEVVYCRKELGAHEFPAKNEFDVKVPVNKNNGGKEYNMVEEKIEFTDLGLKICSKHLIWKHVRYLKHISKVVIDVAFWCELHQGAVDHNAQKVSVVVKDVKEGLHLMQEYIKHKGEHGAEEIANYSFISLNEARKKMSSFLSGFGPKMSGYRIVQASRADPKRMALPEYSQLATRVGDYLVGPDELLWCVYDEEILAMYTHPLSRDPKYVAFFYQEEGPCVVEKVSIDNEKSKIILELKGVTYTLSAPKCPVPPDEIMSSLEITEVTAFSWLDGARKMRPHGKEVFSYGWHHKVNPDTRGPRPLPAGKTNSKQWGASQGLDDWDEEDADVDKTKLKSFQAYLTSEIDYSTTDEVMQEIWAVAESSMHELLRDGKVPYSTMHSTGLDPNSLDHFQQCITEIQDALWEQRYDHALSHIEGARRVFSESQHPFMRSFFDTDDHNARVQILKNLFFKQS